MQSFDFEELLLKFRYPLLILLLGLILTGFGAFIFKSGVLAPQTKVEVLGGTTESQGNGEITAEIAGAVISPGVYKLSVNARIEDLLITAGGLTDTADRNWTDKYLNRAAKLTDGQKVYIPSLDPARDKQSDSLTAKSGGGDQSASPTFSSDSSNLININTAGLDALDSLPGIGQVYGQSIIEHRPYSTPEELVSKGAIKQSLYNKIKDLITIY